MAFQYTIKQLLEVKQFFRDHPQGIIKLHNVWPNATLTKDEWHRWFIECLNRKINRNNEPRGGKDSYQWWLEMQRAKQQLNHPRLVIDWLPKDLRTRFASRLRQRD